MQARISLSYGERGSLVTCFLVAIAALCVSKASGQSLEPWTTEHFRLAMEAQQQGNLDKAAQEYRLIISRTPRFAGAYLNLGIVYHQEKKYSEAVATLKTAASLDPKLVGAEILLGVDEYLTEDFESAAEQLKKGLQLKPRDKLAGTYLGLSYLGLDKPLEAVRVLRLMAGYYPEDPNIQYQLGEAYLAAVNQGLVRLKKMGSQSAFYHWALAIAAERKSDQVTIIEEYMRALSRDPNLLALYWRVAGVLRESGFPNLATAALLRYRALNPYRDVTQLDLGQEAHPSRGDQGQRSENAVAFRRLWEAIPPIHPDPLVPELGDGYVNRALRKGLLSPQRKSLTTILDLYLRGDYEQLIRTLVHSDLCETNWVAAYLLAMAYQEQSHYQEAFQVLEERLVRYVQAPAVSLLAVEIESHLALHDLNRAIAMQPDSYLAKLLLARYYAAAGQDSYALASYREALKLAPDRLGVHLAIGQIYENELHWTSAIAEYKAELRLDPANAMARAHLGHALTEAHEPANAIPVLEELIRANPSDGEAYADLGKAWDTEGQKKKAIEAYDRALFYVPSQISLHYSLFRLYRDVGEKDRALKELVAFKAAEALKKKQDQERVKTLESGQE